MNNDDIDDYVLDKCNEAYTWEQNGEDNGHTAHNDMMILATYFEGIMELLGELVKRMPDKDGAK
jgi:hypothetical protein